MMSRSIDAKRRSWRLCFVSKSIDSGNMPLKRSLAPETPSPRSKRLRTSATPNGSAIKVDALVEVKESVVVEKITPKRRVKTNASTPIKVEELGKSTSKSTPKRKSKTNGTPQVKTEAVVVESTSSTTPKKKKATDVDIKTTDEKVAKVKTKNKPKKGTESEMLAARTALPKILVGAHVSAAGGAHNAVHNATRIGGNAFALFLKNQKQWAFTPLSEETATLFVDGCKKHDYDRGRDIDGCAPIVPHGSYLVNMAHTDDARASQAYTTFMDDLSRCKRMGIGLYNFHPGSAVGQGTRQDALKQLADQLNKAHKDEESGKVITLLETMAAVGGNTIGCTFEELADVISMIEDKSRVGVCMDTCHSFAAGYDLRSAEAYEETMSKFDETVGLKFLRAFHVNDSKAPLSSGRDLHANIGTGFLGLRSFWNLVNDKRMWGLPFILETPIGDDIWAEEIKLLENLVGMDPNGDEFKTLEQDLSAKGKEERDRVGEQVRKAQEKKEKKSSKSEKGPKLAAKSKDIRNMF
jgi:AP endonuclease 1